MPEDMNLEVAHKLTEREQTVRDRGYGHAEGTAGEDQPRSSLSAMLTSSTGG